MESGIRSLDESTEAAYLPLPNTTPLLLMILAWNSLVTSKNSIVDWSTSFLSLSRRVCLLCSINSFQVLIEFWVYSILSIWTWISFWNLHYWITQSGIRFELRSWFEVFILSDLQSISAMAEMPGYALIVLE